MNTHPIQRRSLMFLLRSKTSDCLQLVLYVSSFQRKLNDFAGSFVAIDLEEQVKPTRERASTRVQDRDCTYHWVRHGTAIPPNR